MPLTNCEPGLIKKTSVPDLSNALLAVWQQIPGARFQNLRCSKITQWCKTPPARRKTLLSPSMLPYKTSSYYMVKYRVSECILLLTEYANAHVALHGSAH